MPDRDGYPTIAEIAKFLEWHYGPGCPSPKGTHDVIEHLREIWWEPDWGMKLEEPEGKPVWLELHTGGWSGNETTVEALRGTWFWALFWMQSKRGGHYCFEIPLIFWREVPMSACQDCGKALNATETRLCAGCKWQRNHEAEKRAMYVHYLGFDPEEQEDADG